MKGKFNFKTVRGQGSGFGVEGKGEFWRGAGG